ncbi:MAG: phosphatidate cytidylyltransferase [Spirochaetia bacterium]|nr:phosphatidate cytidylyltransferase [Spirochaetia bacterium]
MGETLKRILSGLVIAAFYILAFNAKWPYYLILYLFCLVFGLLSLREFFYLFESYSKNKKSRKLEYLFGTALLTIFYFDLLKSEKTNIEFINFFLEYFTLNYNLIIGFFIIYLFGVLIRELKSGSIENAFNSIGTAFSAVVYIIIPISHLFLLLKLKDGVFFIWLVSWSTVMSDTMAYFSGKSFGKHKIGFVISPNKTYEGYIGGLIGQLMLTHLFYYIVRSYFDITFFTFIEITIFGIIIYAASILGDLSESLLKRNSGKKDSGNIIPGHGGMLDLIDALLFTIPGFYHTYNIINYFNNI